MWTVWFKEVNVIVEPLAPPPTITPPPPKKQNKNREKNSCFAPTNPLFHFYCNHLQTNFVNINFNVRKSNEYIPTVLYLLSIEKCVLKQLSTVVPFLKLISVERSHSLWWYYYHFNGSSHSCLSKEWIVITSLTTFVWEVSVYPWPHYVWGVSMYLWPLLSERCQCIPDHIIYEGCQCICDHFCLGNWGHCSASRAATL